MLYLVSVIRPVNYHGAEEPPEMGAAINALNEAMVDAGVRVFVGGLHPGTEARTVREGEVVPGPATAHEACIGGFWVLEVANEAAALDWAKRASTACRAPVEVRQFYS